MLSPQWLVMKFGGTSVGRPTNWPTIEQQIRRCMDDGYRPFVVCSALSGVSDLLEALLITADEGRSIDRMMEQLRQRHAKFADTMNLSADSVIDDTCEYILRKLADSANHRPIPAPIRAEIMACGELLSTRLGAQWLQAGDVPMVWKDARKMLDADPPLPGATEDQQFLLGTCSYEVDHELKGELSGLDDDTGVITQGFIASDEEGRTVLLGRGGSDTAAAYFAARLDTHRLEIWTDVPGMFTTNPHEIPAARLLKSLSYDEAETLAGMGAKVLHPHCIRPVREAGIPLHIRWIADPDVPGTLIEAPLTDHANGVKAVSARNSLCLISMDKNAGWQPVGFLADVCSPFKKHAVPIDLLTSSSSNIRATIDLSAEAVLKDKIEPLVSDLSKVCSPTVHENAASVCLVGHEIRATIHELAATLTLLEEQNLFMLTQAANDLTFSFVVPEDKVDALLRTLHETLFEQLLDDEHFGPSWEQLKNGSAKAIR